MMAVAAEPWLVARDLACTRSERVLFRALSVELAAGQGLYVAGDNGVGKTSLLRILCGLLEPSAGEVLWQGRALGKQREALGQALLFIGHLSAVKDDLSAEENLCFAASLAGLRVSAQAVREALARLRLTALAGQLARTMSQGQRRRLALARLALAHAWPDWRAPLWVLDEPFTALDAGGVEVLRQLMDEHLAGGGLLVVTTHQAVDWPASVRSLVLGAPEAEQ